MLGRDKLLQLFFPVEEPGFLQLYKHGAAVPHHSGTVVAAEGHTGSVGVEMAALSQTDVPGLSPFPPPCHFEVAGRYRDKTRPKKGF